MFDFADDVTREAQFEDVEKENAQLCDLVDEVNQELQVAKDEVVKLEEAAVAAVARANSDVLARDGPSALTESLGDIIEAAAEADDPNSAVAVAALRADFKAAQTQINEQKEEIARLEATLLANREVMGMTIEEQMVLISDQVSEMRTGPACPNVLETARVRCRLLLTCCPIPMTSIRLD